jgi:hypothetical protein
MSTDRPLVYAKVNRTGRWYYDVTLRVHGDVRGHWTVLGRRWADNKARRAIRSWQRKQKYTSQSHRVEVPDA